MEIRRNLEEKFIMTAFSGSYTARTHSQSVVTVPDVPDHSVALTAVSGEQKCTDPLWNGATVAFWGTTDTIAGQGTQSGYFTNAHAEGDQNHGNFQGKVTTNGGEVTAEGTWTLTGGTGRFVRVSGRGTYKLRVTSPIDAEVVWDGDYSLG
jgi:hypothetical protein